MQLTDMKNKAEAPSSTLVAADMVEEYPYGLRISLRNEELEKLGITALPAVGSEMTLHASVRVTSTSQNEYQDEKPRMHVELQIEKMAIDSGKRAEKAMYPTMLA